MEDLLLERARCLIDRESALSSDIRRILCETSYAEGVSKVHLEDEHFDFSVIARTLFLRGNCKNEPQ